MPTAALTLHSAHPRRSDIDALRVLAVLLGLVYHCGRLFDTESWHVKNGDVTAWADIAMTLLTPWRMPLLMLLAGAGTWLALGSRSGGEYASERFRRLIVPLVFGMLVIIPPQVYLERISPWMANRMSPSTFDGSFFEFYPSVFTTGAYPSGNLSWHHLWFLVYLFLYSLAALPLFLALRRNGGQRLLGHASRLLASPKGLVLMWLLVLSVQLLLQPFSSNTRALVGDWANLTHYLILFVFGYVMMASDQVSEAIQRHRRAALLLLLGLAALRVVLLASDARAMVPSAAHLALRTAVEWAGLLAILGYGQRYLRRPLPRLGWASEIAYPFYIWHQTVIVVIGYVVVQWQLGIGPKYLVALGLSLAATLALCELVRRVGPLRPLFGMKSRRRASAVQALEPRMVQPRAA